jgi:hypothetical protein
LQNSAGRSVPSATRAAPVSVAQSTIIVGFSDAPSNRASHRISLPSASVLPISTVMPLRVGTTSSGRKALPDTLFSTAGTSRRRRTGSLVAITMAATAIMVAAPAMSFFMFSMPVAGFRSRPPVSKHTPLPTSVTLGSLSRPQTRSIRRGARLLARPTACTIG